MNSNFQLPEDYNHTLAGKYKGESMNFRTNPEVKKRVESMMAAFGMSKQGDVLDYITANFSALLEKATAVSANAHENSNLQAEVESLKAELQEARNQFDDIKRKSDYLEAQKLTETTLLNNPEASVRFFNLKDATEKQLPFLMGLEKERVPLTDAQFVLLMLEYCERDPSKEFPFEGEVKKLVQDHEKRN